jgi:hypothetical protein
MTISFLRMDPLQVVLEFLDEEGYREAFEALQRESETAYRPDALRQHTLRQTLGELSLSDQTVALCSLSAGPNYSTATLVTKAAYPAAPVALLTLPDFVIVAFADQSIGKLTLATELICTVKPSLGTVLAFLRRNETIFCATMGGAIAALNFDLDVIATVEIDNAWILALAFSGGALFAGTRNGFVAVIDPDTLAVTSRFAHPTPVTALCSVTTGVIYALQNDPLFHFRSAAEPNRELLMSMLPNEFDVGCLAVRELVQSPADSAVFAALTDQGRANVYRFVGEKVELLRNVTHFVSDGLTQPQLVWSRGAVIVTSSDCHVLFEIAAWKKAPRCLALADHVLVVGAFDKTVAMFALT